MLIDSADGYYRDQNTLSQGKKKKGDEVVDDEDDDDAMRTSVSQDRVTANCSSALSIYSSPHISDGQPCGGGVRIQTANTTH
jgi:hypothetical protein